MLLFPLFPLPSAEVAYRLDHGLQVLVPKYKLTRYWPCNHSLYGPGWQPRGTSPPCLLYRNREAVS